MPSAASFFHVLLRFAGVAVFAARLDAVNLLASESEFGWHVFGDEWPASFLDLAPSEPGWPTFVDYLTTNWEFVQQISKSDSPPPLLKRFFSITPPENQSSEVLTHFYKTWAKVEHGLELTSKEKTEVVNLTQVQINNEAEGLRKRFLVSALYRPGAADSWRLPEDQARDVLFGVVPGTEDKNIRKLYDKEFLPCAEHSAQAALCDGSIFDETVVEVVSCKLDHATAGGEIVGFRSGGAQHAIVLSAENKKLTWYRRTVVDHDTYGAWEEHASMVDAVYDSDSQKFRLAGDLPLPVEPPPAKNMAILGLIAKKRVAVWILGASGAGKTFSTRVMLPDLLQRNGFDPKRCWLSLDGGIMRESGIGRVWTEMNAIKQLFRNHGSDLKGFGDAYKEYGAPFSEKLKSKLVDLFTGPSQSLSLLLPDTVVPSVVNLNFESKSETEQRDIVLKKSTVYDKLREKGFDIVIVAVNTDAANVLAQAGKRELAEGKKYMDFSWYPSVMAVAWMMNWARQERHNTHWFEVVDNNNHVNVVQRRKNFITWISPKANKVPLVIENLVASFGCRPSDEPPPGISCVQPEQPEV